MGLMNGVLGRPRRIRVLVLGGSEGWEGLRKWVEYYGRIKQYGTVGEKLKDKGDGAMKE